MITIIVCGGRGFADERAVFDALDSLHARLDIACVVSGGAPGADTLAERWARETGVESRVFRADWSAHGRAAGPRRNAEMITGQPVDLVVAFPGGKGTADMVRRADRAQVPVVRPLELMPAAGEP